MVFPHSTTTPFLVKSLDIGYGEYIKYMGDWAAKRGFAFQHQPAFNQPNDQSKAVAVTSIPELEANPGSFAPYRRFVGAAHLAGRNVITEEFGQTELCAFRATVTDIVNLATGAFAGGVNGITLHGYAYSGEYPETSWPGYTVLWYLWTEMWNPQQPAWTHPDDTIPWAGRNQHLLRRGVAKLDFAFVNYTSSFDASKVLYPTEGFNAKGYTYEYLSPSDLLSPAAVVEDGVLAKDGPSYKALVLLEQQYLTPEESAALLAFSEAGLPILIIGSAPKTSLGSTGQKEVTDNIEVLLSRTNVYQYPSKPVESIVDDLVDQGIQPRLSVVSSPGSDATGLYTLWRSSSANQSAVETIEVGTLQKLLPWSEIPQLAQASGVGTYETSFGFAAGAGGNATADGLALRLSFGPVRNTIRAWVNGRQLPPLDLTDAVSDVTEYLVDGRNSVRVEVTSSLGPRNPDLITGPDFDEFGLVGPVVGQVLRRVTVL